MMILSVAAFVAAMQSQGDLRLSFVECLKTAMSQAKTQSVAADGYVDFARARCSQSLDPFKASLVKANVSHGMSRKEAAADADMLVKDYLDEYRDRYQFQIQPGGSD